MLFNLECYQWKTILLLSVTTMVRTPGLSGMPIDMGICMGAWVGSRLCRLVHGYTRIYTVDSSGHQAFHLCSTHTHTHPISLIDFNLYIF